MAPPNPNLVMFEEGAVPPSRLKIALEYCIEKQHPLFIWGQPGIGKSDIVLQAAKKLGRPVIDIRLTLMEPTDLRGIPYLADIRVHDKNGNLLRDETGVPLSEKEFRWSPPSDLPRDEESRAIVFYDEMSSAPPSVQAATYQIILNRRIGNYHLPKGVALVAAGNRVKDKGLAYNMLTPLANRFSHLTGRADKDEWVEWATENRIHKDVVGYIQFQPNHLNQFNPSSDGVAFATPRTWAYVSRLLQEPDQDGRMVDTNLPNEVLADLVKGTIGEGVGIQFMTYRAQAAELPHARDILSGRVTKLNSHKIDIIYALTTSLCYELYDQAHRSGWQPGLPKGSDRVDPSMMAEFQRQMDTFLRFMMDNFQDEMTVMGAKTVLGHFKLPVESGKLKNWSEFVRRFSELMPNSGKS
jgi:hypothetical protein